MDYPADERSLIRKLVATCHLNVAERKHLPGGVAKLSLILDAIEDELRDGGWYPAGLRPDDYFAGGLIERMPDNRCRIHWKSEVSFLRYDWMPSATLRPRDAATIYLKAIFPEQIDGIRIDWQA